jgi:GNAT superfamily N-acetyltransferase
MNMRIQIRPMAQNDIDLIYKGLSGHDISKPRDYVKRCWEENQRIERVTLLAFYESEFVGWGHVLLKRAYLKSQNFDVIPPFRKRGIGCILIEALKEKAFARANTIGIGFGLYADYGTAQRLYIKRGFIPDGRGIIYKNMPPGPHFDGVVSGNILGQAELRFQRGPVFLLPIPAIHRRIKERACGSLFNFHLSDRMLDGGESGDRSVLKRRWPKRKKTTTARLTSRYFQSFVEGYTGENLPRR